MPKKKPKKTLRAFRKFLVRRRPRAAAVLKAEKKPKDGKKKAKTKAKSKVKARRAQEPAHPTVPTAPRIVPVLGSPLQKTLRAASFASRKHMGQKRADGQTPYFSHVARVAFILSHVFECRDEELIAAAFLHDTLEDTATDYDELEEHFGENVADIVVLLTKNNMLPKRLREREYELRLIAAPERVKVAKMADIYDNLSDRVTSVKILKTTATAEKLLTAFRPLLSSPEGILAWEKTSRLLEQITAADVRDQA
ncbi:MAG: bifunctional (p)ppGpp synthetase/guanosine-3',5'-bis(diphosphate) 3'-pyrophosphohydrolase [Verrucomicrobia bacterium]|nr:bifunctional (p)ppGpp synthetase/guanosine-3',5'-bis(diphosphate) 3'-pyrophosphohydrolase [Verrucomicrobiota bacterium]